MNELENYKGVIEDPRSEVEKAKDYQPEEFLGGSVITPKWEAKTSWKVLPLRRQITSSSCGAQAIAKVLEYFNKDTVMSATPIYRFRKNFSGEGMFAQDIGEIGRKKKTTTEAISPSQNMTEAQMNSAPIPDVRPYGISAYYFLPVDMDLIATALEKGHGIIFGIGSHIAEWTEVPQIVSGNLNFSHYVASYDKNYLLHNGEKAVVIDDSVNAYSTINKNGQRILTESFLKKRCWAVLAVVPETEQVKPKHTFTENLVFGNKGKEVEKLQECLIDLGFLKPGLVTGYFGTLTLRAVMAFQEKYKNEILKPVGLSNPNGKFLKYSRTMMNKLYS